MTQESVHSLLSPSGADTWTECYAAPTFVKHLASYNLIAPDSKDPESPSNEGTRAHLILSTALENGVVAEEARHMLPKEERQYTTEEMADAVQVAVDLVADYLDEFPDAEILIETKVNTEPYTGTHDTDGTADIIMVSRKGRTIIVIDYKHGDGVAIHVEKSNQIPLYGLGALAEYKESDFKKIRMVIVQPRHRDVPPVQELEESIKKFVLRADEYLSAASIAGKPKAWMHEKNYNPGEKQCKWCDAAPHCEALSNYMLKMAVKDWEEDDYGPIEPENLIGPINKPQLRVFVQNNLGLFRDWLNRIETDNTEYLLKGYKLPGYKLVHARTKRKFRDEITPNVLAKALQCKPADVRKTSLVGIGEAEKIAVKRGTLERMQDLVIKPIGNPIIAPEDDRRTEYVLFDDDDETDDYDDIFDLDDDDDEDDIFD